MLRAAWITAIFFAPMGSAVADDLSRGNVVVAETCSNISQGLSQMRALLAKFQAMQPFEGVEGEAFGNVYSKLKAKLILLDWQFRVTAGPNASSVLYENEGSGVIGILLDMSDGFIRTQEGRSGQTRLAEKTALDLFDVRSSQLIEACRSDYQG